MIIIICVNHDTYNISYNVCRQSYIMCFNLKYMIGIMDLEILLKILFSKNFIYYILIFYSVYANEKIKRCEGFTF